MLYKGGNVGRRPIRRNNLGALLARLHNPTLKYLFSVGKPRSYSALIEEIQQHIGAKQAANLKVN